MGTLKKTDLPKFVTFILKRLKRAGYQGYVVGGAVRDACLNRPIGDWDVATNASAENIRTIFRDVKHFALKHTTVTLVHSGRHFEVTPFRGTENRLEVDLAYRDFTINAMAFDHENNAQIDPHGGNKDITDRMVRAVVDPQARFREDPLRLLRAIRFANELGFQIEPETLGAIARNALSIQSVSPERVRDELTKILMSPTPSAGFHVMLNTGLLRFVLPELLEGVCHSQHKHTVYGHIMETVDRVQGTGVLRWAALFHDIAKPRAHPDHQEGSAALAAEIMERFRFSSELIQKVSNLVRHHMIGYSSLWTDGAVRRMIRRLGPEQIMDLLRLRRADLLSQDMDDQDLVLLGEFEERIKVQTQDGTAIRIEDLALDGRKVMEFLGISEGPEVGRILRFLMEKITDEPELNEEKKLLALLLHLRNRDC